MKSRKQENGEELIHFIEVEIRLWIKNEFVAKYANNKIPKEASAENDNPNTVL
jgi:hypothetical protein